MENETIYMIEIPSVSNGLKRTYHKKLEVFEKVYLGYNENGFPKYQTVKEHVYNKRNGWIERKSNGYAEIVRNPINHNLMQKASSYTKVLYFSDLEAAKSTKILLINDMKKKKYEEELSDLRKRMEKNVLDVVDLVEEVKEKYPEDFV